MQKDLFWEYVVGPKKGLFFFFFSWDFYFCQAAVDRITSNLSKNQ